MAVISLERFINPKVISTASSMMRGATLYSK